MHKESEIASNREEKFTFVVSCAAFEMYPATTNYTIIAPHKNQKIKEAQQQKQ